MSGMKVAIDGNAPQKAHPSDAAYDLVACVDPVWGYEITLDKGEWHTFFCGFSVAIPERYVGLICSRSGLASRRGLFVLNAPGIIDPGYRGEVGVILMNMGVSRAVVKAGDRIAQLLILPNTQVEFFQAPHVLALNTDREADGFGSTGT